MPIPYHPKLSNAYLYKAIHFYFIIKLKVRVRNMCLQSYYIFIRIKLDWEKLEMREDFPVNRLWIYQDTK